MASSKAKTVAAYLAELPPERRAVIAKVRDTLRPSIPKGYEETMGYGMIMYSVPLSRFPETYNGHPLCYAALAAQKNHNALYLTTVYGHKAHETKLRQAFRAKGKKLDMGKSCVRFQRAEDLPLEVIGEILANVPVEKFIAIYEASRKRGGRDK